MPRPLSEIRISMASPAGRTSMDMRPRGGVDRAASSISCTRMRESMSGSARTSAPLHVRSSNPVQVIALSRTSGAIAASLRTSTSDSTDCLGRAPSPPVRRARLVVWGSKIIAGFESLQVVREPAVGRFARGRPRTCVIDDAGGSCVTSSTRLPAAMGTDDGAPPARGTLRDPRCVSPRRCTSKDPRRQLPAGVSPILRCGLPGCAWQPATSPRRLLWRPRSRPPPHQRADTRPPRPLSSRPDRRGSRRGAAGRRRW